MKTIKAINAMFETTNETVLMLRKVNGVLIIITAIIAVAM